MKSHVEIGANILAPATSPVLRAAADIARTHHEHWDGAGYRQGLSGEAIPLTGRITAVADVFDALTHARSYKEAWDIDRALAEITAQAGRQFDPRVVERVQHAKPRRAPPRRPTSQRAPPPATRASRLTRSRTPPATAAHRRR